MKFHYSDTEIQTLLKTLSVIVDTREQENKHITSYFSQKGIQFINRKLDFGDYACFIPANPEFGLSRDLHFDIAIERKNSLNELSGNIADGRDRFESELLRARGSRFILMIEESAGIEKIVNHKYSTQYNEKAFLATLFTFGHRYNVDINFIEKQYAGMFIHGQLYYYVREQLK